MFVLKFLGGLGCQLVLILFTLFFFLMVVIAGCDSILTGNKPHKYTKAQQKATEEEDSVRNQFRDALKYRKEFNKEFK